MTTARSQLETSGQKRKGGLGVITRQAVSESEMRGMQRRFNVTILSNKRAVTTRRVGRDN